MKQLLLLSALTFLTACGAAETKPAAAPLTCSAVAKSATPATDAAKSGDTPKAVDAKKRVTGIGGIFFKSENPERLYAWYEKYLGIKRDAHGQGASFHWREVEAAKGNESGRKGQTEWSIFSQKTKYFGASKADFMMNYRVDDLEGLLAELKQAGVEIDPHREDQPYGRFAWVTDPDGNRVELWEPPAGK